MSCSDEVCVCVCMVCHSGRMKKQMIKKREAEER